MFYLAGMAFAGIFLGYFGRFVPAIVGKASIAAISCKILIAVFQFIFEFSIAPIHSEMISTKF